MDSDQTKRPGPRRGKFRECRQCLREELSSHHLEASDRRTSYADAEGPQRAALAVLGSLFIQPPAVETHVVMKTFGLCIERVVQESSASGGTPTQRFSIFAQLAEQHCKDKRASVVVGTVTLGKVGDV